MVGHRAEGEEIVQTWGRGQGKRLKVAWRRVKISGTAREPEANCALGGLRVFRDTKPRVSTSTQ